jgi:hypothetical protein
MACLTPVDLVQLFEGRPINLFEICVLGHKW